MPVLYVHGVNTRSRAGFLAIEPMLRSYVAPVISRTPDAVAIEDYYWGNLGVRLAWNGASRPRTRLRGKGVADQQIDLLTRSLAVGEQPGVAKRLPKEAAATSDASGALSAPGRRSPSRKAAPKLSDMSSEELAAFLSGVVTAAREQAMAGAERIPPAEKTPRRGRSGKRSVSVEAGEPTEEEARAAVEYARLIMAIDIVASDPETLRLIVGKTPEQQIELVLRRVREEADRHRAKASAAERLAAKGFWGDAWADLSTRVGEALDRADDLPGYALSLVGAEFRAPLNEIFSGFLGDVFTYLHGRDDPQTRPGAILTGLIETLVRLHKARAKTGEPLVVLTHSMGGQLIWDAVTWRLPQELAAKGARIDFWCAAASQVGFFEEAKLFANSDSIHRTGKPVPFPSAYLGAWWNVWDYNDFLSFTARDICAGVDDSPYDSGSSLLAAHGGYFTRASFFRQLAVKVQAAKKNKFRTP